MIIRGRNIINTGGAVTPPVIGGNKIQVQVTYSNTPVNPTVRFSPAKYNKSVIFNYEQDDSQVGIYDVVFKHFNGGTAFDGVTSSGLTHTDGCGNLVKWKAAVACFCLNAYGVDLMSGVDGMITYPKIYEMLQNDWDVMNHQYGSTPDGIQDADRYQQIRDLSQVIWEKMLEKEMEYRIRGMVNPAAEPGFTLTGFTTKMRIFSSQAGVDDLKDGYPFVYHGNLPQVEALFPNVAVSRDYLGEDFTQDLIQQQATTINNAKARGTKDSPAMLRMFSHGPYPEAPSAAGFRRLANYIREQLGDDVWVPTTVELYEYIETKKLVKREESVNGNVLTINLDLSDIPPESRRRDMSLLISGGNIANVTVNGADSYSYNPSTGLVNVFKKKVTGFVQPKDDAEPPRFISATYSSDNLSQIKLTYNKPITQSLTAGYTFTDTSYNVSSITGDGTTWYLNLNKPIAQGSVLKLSYRGQNGNVRLLNGSMIGTSMIKYPVLMA